MDTREQIINIFKQQSGFARLRDIRSRKINKYHLFKLVENGEIERVKYGLYKLENYPIDEYYEISKIVPKGVICLYSAWYYYELTTYTPFEYHIAAEKKSKLVLPEYPPIKLYFWGQYQMKSYTTIIRFVMYLFYLPQKRVRLLVSFS